MASQALIPTSQPALDAQGSGWNQATSMAAPNARGTSLLGCYKPKPKARLLFVEKLVICLISPGLAGMLDGSLGC